MAGLRWILEQKDRYGVRIVNISVGTQPDLAVYQKYLFLDAVEELWDSGLVVVVSAGQLWSRGGIRSGTRHQPQGDYCGCGAGYRAASCAETKKECQLFRARTYRRMRSKAGCICTGDGDHKLQWKIREVRRTSVYNENRYIDGDPGCLGSGCVSAIQISGYEQCRSEVKIAGILCKNSRTESGWECLT